MDSFILPLLLGIFCIVLGAYNMKGHINSIHWYHRQRVSEKDRLPFGKRVGLGTIIIGAAVVVFSVLSTISMHTQIALWAQLGEIIALAGVIIGLIISLHAIAKYNRGIF